MNIKKFCQVIGTPTDMKKTALIYDKWLHSLGGGEVVACNMAKVLSDAGYEVTLASGKLIPAFIIKKSLGIEMKNITFVELWNDEAYLKKLCENKDLFINVSFMDYSYGYAKKNIYYTLFPTESYVNLKGWFFNNFILPLSSKIIKPLEFINKPEASIMKNGHYMHLVSSNTRIAFSYLKMDKVYFMKFSLFIEDFTKTNLESYTWFIENAKITATKVYVNHNQNVINYSIYLQPTSSTIYFEIKEKQGYKNIIYLLYPKIIPFIMPDFIYRFIYEKVNSRLRAGLFNNILKRLDSYDLILSDSEFTRKWTQIYWKKKSKLLYPPVEFITPIHTAAKEKWIVHVGRFFTLGHGKRQEVLIEAFKKFYDKGNRTWQLHLIGGVGSEPSSISFVNSLKLQSQGYPIVFHFNISRNKVEEILQKSSIYWHATGFQEDEEKKPIKFEHFGISVIEAISAGCIPILYNGGGLPEIINKLGLSKNHLFDTIDDLVNKTILLSDNNRINLLKNKALKTKLINTFSVNAFSKNLIETV